MHIFTIYNLGILHGIQALQIELEMTSQKTAEYMDELEGVDAAPKRQTRMIRSNSIIF